MSLTRADIPPDLWQYNYQLRKRRWHGFATWRSVTQREFIGALFNSGAISGNSNPADVLAVYHAGMVTTYGNTSFRALKA